MHSYNKFTIQVIRFGGNERCRLDPSLDFSENHLSAHWSEYKWGTLIYVFCMNNNKNGRSKPITHGVTAM